MKNLIFVITILFSVLIALSACDPQDILTHKPTDEISETAVWNDPQLIEAFLSEIYFGLSHGANQSQLGSMSDDASSIPDRGTGIVVESNVTPGSLGNLLGARSDQFKWAHNYKKIREVNILLSKIDDAPIGDELKDRIKGEAHYLRAHFYHNLMKSHGGVPIIEGVFGLGDEGMNVPRNSFKETVDFIVQDLEAAAEKLPAVWTGDNLGRASAGAALALKARVLLYAASDLYQINPSGMPETGYIGGQDRQSFWRAAKDAARDVMDLGVYELVHAEPAPEDSVAENYYRMFLTPNNGESIMERYFTGTVRHGRNANFTPNTYHGPNGFHHWGGTTPTQQLVDAYQMNDGSKFDWNNPAHAADPYKDRDPRLYGTILYDGAKWKERSAAGIAMDRDGVIQTFLRLTLPDGSDVPGLDARDSPIENWNSTRSGYYMRKWLNEDLPLKTRAMPGIWIFIRYAEVLLNYAEASIELGEENDARVALNQIRRRAGMPEYGSEVSGQELKDKYRNERRVELALEEHRFWDIRRWMIAPEVMNEDARSIQIFVEGTNRADRSTYFNYRYEVGTYQNRRWDDKMYFFPIIQDEMDRNNQLVQNPGF